jgi:DNA modification methylase
MKTVYCGDSAVVLKTFPDCCIDMVCTSPPYDNLREYKGYEFDFEVIAKELYRVMKPGGVMVWVVGDATISGSETGTSFRQALYFKEIGFNLHDTMIYRVSGTGAKGSNYAYFQGFEYMFVFCKGKIKTFNPIADHKNKTAGRKKNNNGDKNKTRMGEYTIRAYSKRDNVWVYAVGGSGVDHPAPFPEALARDHILSWSNPGDLVLDCFAGSGTTLKMAKMLSREYIGIEISPEYVSIIEKRLLATNVPLFA